jgi:AcrR family transcriptional regulator
MIRAHIDVVTDDLGNAASFLQEWRFLSDERRLAIGKRRDAYEARFRDVVEQGITNGEMSQSTDPALSATMVLSALNGLATWYRPGGRLTSAQIADRYAEVFRRGLSANPPR